MRSWDLSEKFLNNTPTNLSISYQLVTIFSASVTASNNCNKPTKYHTRPRRVVSLLLMTVQSCLMVTLSFSLFTLHTVSKSTELNWLWAKPRRENETVYFFYYFQYRKSSLTNYSQNDVIPLRWANIGCVALLIFFLSYSVLNKQLNTKYLRLKDNFYGFNDRYCFSFPLLLLLYITDSLAIIKIDKPNTDFFLD